MSKQKRAVTLAVVCGTLAVCVGGYFAARHLQEKQAQQDAQQTEKITITNYSADGMTALSYYFSDTAQTLSFTRTDAGWVLDSEAEYPLNQTKITAMAKAVAQVQAERTVEKKDYTEADFGLDDETVYVVVTSTYLDSNQVPFSVTMRISEQDAFTQNCYCSVSGDETLYMINADVAGNFAYSQKDLLQTESLPQINADTLYSVIAEGPDGACTEIVDQTGLDALKSLYQNLTIKNMYTYTQNAQSLQQTGLDTPIKLTFRYTKDLQVQQDDGSVDTVTTDASSTVLLGASFTDTSGNPYTYYTFDALRYIYYIPKETADFLAAYTTYVPVVQPEQTTTQAQSD